MGSHAAFTGAIICRTVKLEVRTEKGRELCVLCFLLFKSGCLVAESGAAIVEWMSLLNNLSDVLRDMAARRQYAPALVELVQQAAQAESSVDHVPAARRADA